jgi:small subunit ribosomal protein S4
MGDQKFQHKKYSTPRHPWEAARIEQEKEILERYGLKNKKELWKSLSILDSFRTQARTLEGKMRYQDQYSMQQFKNMIRRLQRFNILNEGATLDDVLSLKIDDILERRLQTLVFKMKLAATMKQARQLITHGEISLGGRRVTIPGLMVEASLEPTLSYDPDSPLMDELHPLRQAMLKSNKEKGEEKEAPAEAIVEENKETHENEVKEPAKEGEN